MQEKNIVITGATSGIGKACAFALAPMAKNLVLTGRRQERLLAIEKELKATYPNLIIHCLAFDVQQKEACFTAFKKLETILLHVDILINNAGLALGRERFDVADINDWEIMIDTNIKGILYCTRALLPLIKKSTQPHIVIIGSTAAKEVYENGNVYCATKSAVEAIAKSMRIDLLPFAIKVTCIHPGAVDTEFSVVRFKGNEAKAATVYENYTPLFAEDVALVIQQTISLPQNICLNDVVVTCLAQANSMYLYKKA
jgi:3-hydroxy acid dehydrogenase / malonic semialdehyde reductase